MNNALRLLEAIKNNTASHAILITGPDGSDLNGLGRQVAALYCSVSPDDLVNYPDYQELGKNGIIINHIREMQKALSTRAFHQNRAILLCDAHNMTEQAQNALLKTLEEPPLNTMLILAGQENSLLYTIRSRCAIVRIEAVLEKDILSMLLQKGIEDSAARLAASLCGGAVLLAERMATPAYMDFFKQAYRLYFMLFKTNMPPYSEMAVLLDCPAFEPDGTDRSKTEQRRETGKSCLHIWHNIAIMQLRKTIGLSPGMLDLAQTTTSPAHFTIAGIQDMINLISSAMRRIEVANPQLTMNALITAICSNWSI